MRWTLQDRKWHPIDDGVLPYFLALMRSLWVWPLVSLWSIFIAASPTSLLSWPAIFGLLAASTAVAQYAAFRLRPARRGARVGNSGQWLVALSGLAAVILALYLGVGRATAPLWDVRWLGSVAANSLNAVFITIVATWLWWWGLMAGRGAIYYDTYAGNFALGVAGLALAAVVSYAAGATPRVALLGPALAFFAVSLFTLAVASLRSAQRFERERADPTFRVSRHWLMSIGGVVALLLAVGLLLVQLLTPDVVRQVLAAASPLVNAAAQVLYWIIVAVAWVFFTLMDALARLLPSREAAEVEPLMLQAPPNFAEQFQNLENEPPGLPPGAYLALRILAALLIAGAVLLIFGLALRRFRALVEDDVTEVRDSVLSLDLLKAQLGQFLKRRQPVAAPPPFASVAGDDPRAQVRRTYQAMLAWLAGRELARAPGVTPEEYLRFVSRALPEHRAPLTAITAAYVRARYSPGPLPEEVAIEAARAWEQIEHPASGP